MAINFFVRVGVKETGELEMIARSMCEQIYTLITRPFCVQVTRYSQTTVSLPSNNVTAHIIITCRHHPSGASKILINLITLQLEVKQYEAGISLSSYRK
jgi:hypothetical protein